MGDVAEIRTSLEPDACWIGFMHRSGRMDVTHTLPHISTRYAWREDIEHITEKRDICLDLWRANKAVAEA